MKELEKLLSAEKVDSEKVIKLFKAEQKKAEAVQKSYDEFVNKVIAKTSEEFVKSL